MNNPSQKSLASDTSSYSDRRNLNVVHPSTEQCSFDDSDDDDDFYGFFNQPEYLTENNECLAPGASPIPYNDLPDESDPGNEVPCYDYAGGSANGVNPAVAELINTEKSYVKSLQYIVSNIHDKLKEVPEVDVNILFSNVHEVLQVASSFIAELEQTDAENQLTHIGDMFQQYRWDMEEVYARYCWGYQRALTLLEQYKETHVYEKLQQALLTGSTSRQYPDITFHLVIPIQRVTKYPLLLKRILEIKSLSKEAEEALEGAFQTVLEMNDCINEKKRSKELAVRYVQGDHRTLREKVSQLNKHTLSKKMARLSRNAKFRTGITPKREDQEFDYLVKHFHSLTSVVAQLQQNVACYMEFLQEFLLRQHDSSCMDEQPEASLHKPNFSRELYQNIYPKFKERLEILVLQPLSNLSDCLKGPNYLIRKRMDKLLDYENLEEKHSETGKMSSEEAEIMKTYKAIHDLLLSELPHCISVSKKLLCHVLRSYIELNQELTKKGLQAAEAEASRLEHSTLPKADFMKWVNDCMTLSDVHLKELTKNFEAMPAPSIQDQSPVQDHQIQMLLKRYKADKIYQVMQAITGSKTLDLTLKRGDYVAVLQFSDTKANRSRWLVDTGGARGYVPCNKLQQYKVDTARKNSLDSLALPTQQFENRRHSFTSPYISSTTPKPVQTFQAYAMYAFTARNDHEVSLKQGEPVIILEPHDKKGRPEWSLVEVSGHQGYVPSNFLGKMPVQISPYGMPMYR